MRGFMKINQHELEHQLLLNGAKREGNGYTTLCPVHGDKNPSLSVKFTDDGKVLTYCHSHQCSHTEIMSEFKNRGWVSISDSKAVFRPVKTAVDASQALKYKQVAESAHKKFKADKKLRSTGYLKRKLKSEVEVYIDKTKYGFCEVFYCYNIDDDITGYQQIYNQNGKNKFYLSGMKKEGSFYPIGDYANADEIILTEGIATGYSVARSLNKVVVCAMDVKNIAAVLQAFQQKYPQKKLIIAADNDHTKEKNVGLNAAKAISASCGVQYFYPPTDDNIKDFNDLEIIKGREAVMDAYNDLKIEQPQKPELNLEELKSEFDFAKFFFQNECVLNGIQCCYLIDDEYYVYNNGKYDQINKRVFKSLVTRFYQKHEALAQRLRNSFLNSIINHIDGLVLLESNFELNKKMGDAHFKDSFISLKNGILLIPKNIETEVFKLIPHSPDYFTTVKLPYEYNMDSNCPVFDAFLNEMLPDQVSQQFIWEWFGYNLIPQLNYSKMLILAGEGANGKTVVATALAEMLGRENTSSVNLDSFSAQRTFPLSAMVGKLANIVGDLNETNKHAEGLLKSIVAQEQVTIERKGRDPQQVIVTAKQTFCANAVPKWKDTTDGIYRRLIPLPMKIQILDESKQNRNLINGKYWQDSGELSGILNKSLAALKTLLIRGKFEVPKDSEQFLHQYRDDNNPAREFLKANYVEADPNCFVFSSETYFRYKGFCDENGIYPISSKQLSQELQRLFKTAKRSHSASYNAVTQRKEFRYFGVTKTPDLGAR